MVAIDEEALQKILAAHLDRVEKAIAKAGLASDARRHLTLKDAAAYAARSVDTLRNACLRKEINYTQTGRGAVITIAIGDLNKWLEKNAVREIRR
jgi:hypothetical protein